MKKTNKNKGFTIVELVIVIAVIAILSAVLIPTFGTVISDANKTSAQQEARNAYTHFIQDNKTDAAKLDANLVIKAGEYYFYVVDGQIKDAPATAADLHDYNTTAAATYSKATVYLITECTTNNCPTCGYVAPPADETEGE